MLFGTAKRISLQSRQMEVKFRGTLINNTEAYTYLGHLLDKNLSMRDNFDKAYKKSCNRLKLLSKLRHSMNSDTVLRIYQTMSQPIMTYTGMLKMHFSGTQLGKMESIERRVRNMTSSSEKLVPSIVKRLHKQACKTVRQCLDKQICTNFHEYFRLNEHNRNTRNMGFLVNIPKVKLEICQAIILFLRCQNYNDLPIEIRREQNYRKFLNLLNEHFKR